MFYSIEGDLGNPPLIINTEHVTNINVSTEHDDNNYIEFEYVNNTSDIIEFEEEMNLYIKYNNLCNDLKVVGINKQSPEKFEGLSK